MASNVIFVRTKKELDEAIKFLESLKAIALDTETTGFDPLTEKILLISAGNMYRQYVFDVFSLEKHLQPLKDILNKPEPVKILHNAKFDYKFFKQDLGVVLENIYDTMIAEMLLLKGKKFTEEVQDQNTGRMKKEVKSGYALDDVASKYCSLTMNKDVRATFTKMKYGDKIFSKEQVKYSGEDVANLHVIREKQLLLIESHDLQKVCKLEMAAIAPTGDMELNGMYLDPIKWAAVEKEAMNAREVAKKALDDLFAPIVGVDMFGNAAINYNSPKQLLPALKKLIGAAAANLKTTTEADLKEINHPAIKILLTYREKEKRVSTYGKEFLTNIHPKTGRIHCNFSQLFTDTGRYSSSNP